MVSLFKLKKPVSVKKAVEKSVTKTIASAANTFHAQDYENLKPLLILMDCQSKKEYISWENPELELSVDNRVLPIYKLSLIGTLLQIVVLSTSNEYDNVLTVDVTDNLSTKLEFSTVACEINNSITIIAKDPLLLSHLQFSFSLAQFEKMSLYKSLTASIISTMGLKIADVHMILNSSYNFKDWCYIHCNGEWIKAYIHIDKRSKYNGSPKGNHQVKFFRDDKSLTSKNLICFISDCDIVEDLFFVNDQEQGLPTLRENQLQTLLRSGMNPEEAVNVFFSKLTTLKVLGNVHWPTNSPRSSRSRSSSLSWATTSPRKRTTSFSMTSPFHKRTASNTSIAMSPIQSQKHKKTGSIVSSSSTVFHPSVQDNAGTTTQSLLIKPIPHKGVHHLETMIRFIVPMMDCLQLYGRPEHFKSSRTDMDSLAFGLPKLPAVDFFAKEELTSVFQQNDDLRNSSNSNGLPADQLSMPFSMSFYKGCLEQKLENQGRESLTFTTIGDIWYSRQSPSLLNTFHNSSWSTSSSPIV